MIRTTLTALLLATPILLAPLAHADIDGFVSDLDSIGVHHPSPGQLGHMLCNQLDAGNSHYEVASALSNASVQNQGTDDGISLSTAQEVVGYAVTDLCPGE